LAELTTVDARQRVCKALEAQRDEPELLNKFFDVRPVKLLQLELQKPAEQK
jgi:hypothetical protein